LDTGSFLSTLPDEWMPVLSPFLTLDPKPVPFATATGSGVGRLARNVPTAFEDAPEKAYSFDWLVTEGLNGRGYGLLSLRDLLTYFTIRTVGSLLQYDNGIPSALPDLELILNG
jgi:hypothetical protein